MLNLLKIDVANNSEKLPTVLIFLWYAEEQVLFWDTRGINAIQKGRKKVTLIIKQQNYFTFSNMEF